MSTDEQLAALMRAIWPEITAEDVRENRAYHAGREHRRRTHPTRVGEGGLYYCTVCGAVERELGDNVCPGQNAVLPASVQIAGESVDNLLSTNLGTSGVPAWGAAPACTWTLDNILKHLEKILPPEPEEGTEEYIYRRTRAVMLPASYFDDLPTVAMVGDDLPFHFPTLLLIRGGHLAGHYAFFLGAEHSTGYLRWEIIACLNLKTGELSPAKELTDEG